jgi:hypothetical protein
MKKNPRSNSNRKKAKTVLRLPDLEFAKAAVLNSLTSLDVQSMIAPFLLDPVRQRQAIR